MRNRSSTPSGTRVRGLPGLMHCLGVDAAVVSTLDYVPTPGLEAEGFAPQETDKLAQAEARRLGVGFHWALPKPDAPGTTCRENIDRSLYVGADGSVSPCVYVNLPVNAFGPQAAGLRQCA